MQVRKHLCLNPGLLAVHNMKNKHCSVEVSTRVAVRDDEGDDGLQWKIWHFLGVACAILANRTPYQSRPERRVNIYLMSAL
jgi:hypothetical protein